MDGMNCPTPCICGRIVELDEMKSIWHVLPDGGNLVCEECWCDICDGSGECDACDGSGECFHCERVCDDCGATGKCSACAGEGYMISLEETE